MQYIFVYKIIPTSKRVPDWFDIRLLVGELSFGVVIPYFGSISACETNLFYKQQPLPLHAGHKCQTHFYILYVFILLTALWLHLILVITVTALTLFPATGDGGCFYIGMGSKGQTDPNLDSFKCCPSKPARTHKIAKVERKPVNKAPPKPTTKPVTKPQPSFRPNPKPQIGKQEPAKKAFGSVVAKQNEKPTAKSKKGFFGKYMSWW